MPNSPTADVARKRARVAGFARHRPADDPALAEARRELTAARLEADVRKIADAMPPLTDSQRTRIVAILRGGNGAADVE